MKYLVYVLVCLFALALVGCGNKEETEPVSEPVAQVSEEVKEEVKEEPKEEAKTPEKVTKLQIIDEVDGTGDPVKEGQTVTVHYTGKLDTGKVFDSSVERNEPFSFTVGEGQVIEGWEKGLIGMKKGGKRKLVIPPDMGYGDRDMGDIPPNSVLYFEIELVDIN